jgi:hypothetical protein
MRKVEKLCHSRYVTVESLSFRKTPAQLERMEDLYVALPRTRHLMRNLPWSCEGAARDAGLTALRWVFS